MFSIFKNKQKKEILQALALISQIGINMTVTILGCLIFGNFLDNKLNTSPWLLFLFIILGVLAAFRNLYHMTKKF